SLLELDADGQLISQEAYFPFGGTAVSATRDQVEADYKTLRYSGKERDATGLYYYGYRYYQPWAGRWLSADPAGTIDGLNLYRMVRNNPVLLCDEKGLKPKFKFLSCFNFFKRSKKKTSPQPEAAVASPTEPEPEPAIASTSIGDAETESPAIVPTATTDNMPNKGDLIYGVHASPGRKQYMSAFKEFRNAVNTIDEYSLLKTDGPVTMEKNESFKNLMASHDKFKTAVRGSGSNEDIRRKCKGGIAWAVENNIKVHFALDGMDLDKVVLKNFDGKNGDREEINGSKKNRSITGSELRWVYRHRNDPAVRKMVTFWNDRKNIPAPWEENVSMLETIDNETGDEIFKTYDKNMWLNYKPKGRQIAE
ncbi:RHS repeat domain-containing protein, partial [Ewingella americana]